MEEVMKFKCSKPGLRTGKNTSTYQVHRAQSSQLDSKHNAEMPQTPQGEHVT